jgi:membrane-associated phospholipid phosphatase
MPTYQGDQGDQGDQGNAGNASGSSGGAFFADRVDLPFVTAEHPAGDPISKQRIDIPSFPYRNWAPNWYAWLVLTEFVRTDWDSLGDKILPSWAPTGDWNSRVPAPGQRYSAYDMVQGELNCLVTAAEDERADALGVILGQATEFISYFLDLLTASNGYPETTKVLSIANFIAGFCAMYYKGRYQRPRASMLCPALMPPIPVPGHASFPSGHSTQAHLIAYCAIELLNGLPQLPAMENDLLALADRIARNREIAGLHYPSDSEGGKKLARNVLPLLIGSGSWYQEARKAARAEWCD